MARVDGSTLVVTANDGSEVQVDTKGATITQPAPIAVSALTAGELVIVQGTTNADGTVTATQVTANNAANAPAVAVAAVVVERAPPDPPRRRAGDAGRRPLVAASRSPSGPARPDHHQSPATG